MLVLLLKTGQHGSLKEVALVANAHATGFEVGMVWQAVDETLNALKLVGIVYRAVQDVIARWIAGDCGGLHFGN